MQWLYLFSLLLLLGFYYAGAQRQDCRRIKEQCGPCIRRLVDPKNDLEFINRDCREKLRDRWVWRDVKRCDMQILACENHDQKLDCENVARLAGMRRLIG